MKSFKYGLDTHLAYTEEIKILYDNVEENRKLQKKTKLLQNMLDNDSPISTYGYFTITGGAFLFAVATILPYLIALILFKLSEVPLSND